MKKTCFICKNREECQYLKNAVNRIAVMGQLPIHTEHRADKEDYQATLDYCSRLSPKRCGMFKEDPLYAKTKKEEKESWDKFTNHLSGFFQKDKQDNRYEKKDD